MPTLDCNDDATIICRHQDIKPDAWKTIEPLWRTLELNACNTPFTNWYWLKAWLQTCLKSQAELVLVEAKVEHTLVGLAILLKRKKMLVPGIRLKQLWLHKSGNMEDDQVWIEHNQFLTHRDFDVQANAAIYEYLFSLDILDELYVGLCKTKHLCEHLPAYFCKRLDILSVGYEVDLSQCRSIEDYLAQLSKNTRSQINRTKRHLSQLGQFSLHLKADHSSKVTSFQDMANIHKERWAMTQFGSGFNNPKFVKFHQQILFEDKHNRHTRIYALTLNNETLGYIYLLTDHNTWYFYLSAIKLHESNKIKIGLLFHTLVIEQAIQAGVNCYDFLAGEARYKQSLSNKQGYKQYLCCYYANTRLLRLREKLRHLKNRIKLHIPHKVGR